MDYLSGMPLDYQSEIKRLECAQLELIEAMDEAAENGDNQFAIAIIDHFKSIQQELDRLWSER